MTDVMQRCVPLSTGALGPDLRVNYQFGLVLGVDEFEQEDQYFRERDERASRTLHGYGTADGLHVVTARSVLSPDDVEVRVEPGIAVDQFGRPIVINAAQCALIGAWLAAEEKRAAADGTPSPLDTHRRPSGDVTLYVVASYSSCYDALVPLPGNPCGSDDDVTAPSRIRDAWDLELRWDPPAMPAWDGVRALADLLLTVDVHDGSPLISDEDLIAAHIRALAPGAPAPLAPLPAVPVLPRAQARAALDRLLTLWVTEVRPTLAPDLLAPEGDAAVLLATLTLVPAAAFDPDHPVIDGFSPPDDEGRPYLAPTQLIQELTLLGGGAGVTVLAGSPIEQAAASPVIELASLDMAAGPGGARGLILWSHLPAPLVLPVTLPVARDDGAPEGFAVGAGLDPTTFTLSPPGAVGLADGERLDVTLPLAQLAVRDVAAGVDVPLLQWLQRTGLDLAGRVGDVVTLHHRVEAAPAAAPPAVSRPVRQIVTATPARVDNSVGIELWFHVDKQLDVDTERVPDLSADAVVVVAEIEAAATPVRIPFEIVAVQHNVFRLDLDTAVWKRRGRSSPFFRVLIKLEGIQLADFGGDLASYLIDLDLVGDGVEDDGRLLALWVRMPS